MTLQSIFALAFTILLSIAFIAVIILLGWILIWKAFLSKFRLVRELLGQEADEQRVGDNGQIDKTSHVKSRKLRKD